MAHILYIFPHPDDESFGPAPLMARQRRQGHRVSLLTLTRGEATRQRAKYGYSKEKMGAIRFEEMQAVARALDLNDLTVLDFPDGDLPRVNARTLETAIADHIRRLQPGVVVTYPVHGISGHPDHMVTHRVVKRVYRTLKKVSAPFLQRLAFYTLPEENRTGRSDHLMGSPPEDIHCIVPIADDDLARGHAALECYTTYRDVIEEQQPLKTLADGICFSFYEETYLPPLDDLCAGLAA
ncbi:MAG: PIG-L deacetylase family protein [Rhodothermales bacterium]